jgi:pilus assembly protein CpaC
MFAPYSRMRSKLVISLLFIATISYGNKFVMIQGETVFIKATDIKHVFSGNARVIKVKAVKSKLLSVTAIGPGESSLNLSSSNKEIRHHFTVLSKKIDETYRILKTKLKTMSGIKIFTGRGKIHLSGNVNSLDNFNELVEVTNKKSFISSSINITPRAVKIEAQNILRILKKIELTDSILKYLERLNKILIYIKVKNKKEEKTVKEVLSPFKNIIIPNIAVEPASRKSVTLLVKFVELKYGNENEYGIKWSNSFEIIPYSKKINALIKAHERTGYAKTIASPRLVCASGKKATFLAGGQIPLKIINSQNSSHVEWKKYGIELEFSPVLIKNDMINLNILISVSDLDYSNALENIPAISSRKVGTSLSIRNGKTFFISGLIKNNKGKNVEQIPFLSSLPILGELFKSHSFLNDKSELVILITPTVNLNNQDNLQLKIKSFEELMEKNR